MHFVKMDQRVPTRTSRRPKFVATRVAAGHRDFVATICGRRVFTNHDARRHTTSPPHTRQRVTVIDDQTDGPILKFMVLAPGCPSLRRSCRTG